MAKLVASAVLLLAVVRGAEKGHNFKRDLPFFFGRR
jgi:hypothetical protein